MQRKTYGRKLTDPERKFERKSEQCRKKDLIEAIIDGLWLEGGLLPKAFAPEEITNIGLNSCEAILGVELVKA